MSRTRTASVLIALLVAAAVLPAALLPGANAGSQVAAAATKGHRNMVSILAHDPSWNLVNSRFAPHVTALPRRGVTFAHYFVAASRSCPSRATIFTGSLPPGPH